MRGGQTWVNAGDHEPLLEWAKRQLSESTIFVVFAWLSKSALHVGKLCWTAVVFLVISGWSTIETGLDGSPKRPYMYTFACKPRRRRSSSRESDFEVITSNSLEPKPNAAMGIEANWRQNTEHDILVGFPRVALWDHEISSQMLVLVEDALLWDWRGRRVRRYSGLRCYRQTPSGLEAARPFASTA